MDPTAPPSLGGDSLPAQALPAEEGSAALTATDEAGTAMPHPEHLQPSTVVDLTQPGAQPNSFTMIKTSSEDSDSGSSVKSALSPQLQLEAQAEMAGEDTSVSSEKTLAFTGSAERDSPTFNAASPLVPGGAGPGDNPPSVEVPDHGDTSPTGGHPTVPHRDHRAAPSEQEPLPPIALVDQQALMGQRQSDGLRNGVPPAPATTPVKQYPAYYPYVRRVLRNCA